MSLTRWCEDLACLGVELSHEELKSLSEHVSKIAEITKRIKQGANNRPQRSDTWFRAVYALDSVRHPDLYFNFSLGTVRVEVRKVSREFYAVYMCNWTLYAEDTTFDYNLGILDGVKSVTVRFVSGWYAYGASDKLTFDQAVSLHRFCVGEFCRLSWDTLKDYYYVH